MSLLFSALQTHESSWDPSQLQVTLNVSLDACFVPSESQGTRLDTAHLVCIDNFIDERIRQALLDAITQPGWDPASGAPPSNKWEASTSDTADAPRTWGLKHGALEEFERSDLWAKVEVQSRLVKLYPEVDIVHQPSDIIQCRGCSQQPADIAGDDSAAALTSAGEGPEASMPAEPSFQPGTSVLQPVTTCPITSQGQPQVQQSAPREASATAAVDTGQGISDATADQQDHDNDDIAAAKGETTYDCHAILANAAARGDEFAWHQDADPQTFDPDSVFTQTFGQYTNREPGKPLFVSLLLYLNDQWPRDWAADTLFLDTPSDTGIVVRPKPYRAVLMDQDVLHRLSAPYKPAGHTPRYSLVWKLVFLPKEAGQQCSIARPEWGEPDAFGSAAKAQAVVRQLARKRKASSQLQ